TLREKALSRGSGDTSGSALKINSGSGRRRRMLDRHCEPKLLQAPDQAAFSAWSIALIEVGRTHLLVGLLAGQHVVGSDEVPGPARHDGALAPALGRQAVILSR